MNIRWLDNMNILIIGISIVLLIIILYSNIKVEINFKRYDEDDILSINITVFYGIFKYKKQIPFMDLVNGRDNISALEFKSKVEYNEKLKCANKSVINVSEAEKIINKYRKLYIRFEKFIVPFIKRIKEKIIIRKIYLNTELGTNDAAETAVITGIIWSIKSYVVTILANNYNLSDVFVNVVPNYNISTFKTSIDCIFSIKLGNIINEVVKTLLANKRDGVKNE